MTERQTRIPHRQRSDQRPDGGIDQQVADAIARHSAAGRRFTAAGVESFAREQGRGPVVILLHGLPDSSFVFRRVLPELADLGMRGIAFDLPGMGLAQRPGDFDYSFEGLLNWVEAAIDALAIDRAHVVVHDIGGPLGFGWAARNPDRVLSLTALNSIADPDRVQVPLSLRPLAVRGAGEVWLRDTPRSVLARTFYRLGVTDPDSVPLADVYAHIGLLRMHDRGDAFLKIVRTFGLTSERIDAIATDLAGREWPARIVWGRDDRALGSEQLEACSVLLGVEHPLILEARHYPQEDHARDVAEAVADLVAPLG